MTAFGRTDLVVSAGDYLYVIEMKLVHREEDIAKKLEEAKKQIITRQYDVRLTTKKKSSSSSFSNKPVHCL